MPHRPPLWADKVNRREAFRAAENARDLAGDAFATVNAVMVGCVLGLVMIGELQKAGALDMPTPLLHPPGP